MTLGLIVGMSFLDMCMTYYYLTIFKDHIIKTKNKKLRWEDSERNPLIRFFIKRFGLGYGMLMTAPLIISIVFAIATFLPETGKFFLLGILTMVNIMHVTNMLALKQLS